MPSPKKSTNKTKSATPRKTIAKSKAVTAGKSAARSRPSTEFNLYAPEARQVFLAGNFSDWQPESCPMRRFKDGNWKKKLPLKPGRYEYRFVVDGNWWTDPENPDRQYNPYGQENSVLNIA